MGDIYVYMLIILAGLAITDLVVGVSNDAVNFLNSAIGSKAISFKTIMIIASIGIAVGALSSSGMMEVARKGIFKPEFFYFDEVMIIFMAVMITDVLLLDFFNTLGLPTSTTVSIVFELLGAAVCISLLKIYVEGDGTETIADLGTYINSDKALMIIAGILGSVVIAFTIGAIAQFLSRLLLTFQYKKRPSIYASLFGGLSLISLVYFIIIKGLGKTDFSVVQQAASYIESHMAVTFIIGFLILSLISFVYIQILKGDIYKLIIILGTFGLAMAFAGNDLVNFIGVVIGAKQAWVLWVESGVAATDFNMAVLAAPQKSPFWFLLGAGLIMVLTLWFSSKAQAVVKTSVDLARQDSGTERFQPNALSRIVVRYSIALSAGIERILPKKTTQFIASRFEKPTEIAILPKHADKPAFDYVRAAVNLMIASILISIATTYLTLPLSTTYVTFMVAMGTSLADRAWGTESAVYRIAGVVNVIGGWFFTAFSAFTAAAIFAAIIYYGGFTAIVILVIIAIGLLIRSYLSHKKQQKEVKVTEELQKAESNTIQGIIEESSANVATVFKRAKRIYKNTLDGLIAQDLSLLKASKKQAIKLSEEIDGLRNNVFYLIRGMEDQHLGASRFYIEVLGHLQDISQSLDYISKSSTTHIDNNHKSLKFTQIKDLKEVILESYNIFEKAQEVFNAQDFGNLDTVITLKLALLENVDQKIDKQVQRTKDTENSPKNATLYFGLMLETRDLINATMNVVEQYYTQYDASRFSESE